MKESLRSLFKIILFSGLPFAIVITFFEFKFPPEDVLNSLVKISICASIFGILQWRTEDFYINSAHQKKIVYLQETPGKIFDALLVIFRSQGFKSLKFPGDKFFELSAKTNPGLFSFGNIITAEIYRDRENGSIVRLSCKPRFFWVKFDSGQGRRILQTLIDRIQEKV